MTLIKFRIEYPLYHFISEFLSPFSHIDKALELVELKQNSRFKNVGAGHKLIYNHI